MLFFKKLNALFSKSDRKFLFLMVCLSIIVAIIETAGVAVIMPFISVASDFSLIQTNKYFKYFYTLFSFSSDVDFIIFLGVLLITFYLIRGLLNIFYSYMLSKFSQGRVYSLSFRLFKTYLNLSYHKFVNKNSAELSKVIISETQYLTIIISSLLLMISEIFVIIFIYSLMLYIDFKITLVITCFLIVNVLILVNTVSKRIKKQGTIREKFQRDFFKIINSTFGNFKIIKLHTNEDIIIDKFNIMSKGFTKTGIVYETLGSLPRIFLEMVAFSLLSLIVIFLLYTSQGDISTFLGVLSMFVLGLYRLLPSANRILTSYNQIMYNYRSLELIHNDLMDTGEDLGNESITFKQNLVLKNVKFGYSSKKLILNNINLEIKKNDKIAFVGASGSGKSTLVDLLIGLYNPDSGALFIDNILISEKNIRNLREKVGYIPQSVYLFDGTVGENISFGNEYNEEKIKEVLTKAKIYTFLEEQQEGINTFVGEGGIKLSGGQKQRIAIARALYNDPEILVLDEATSALDNDIEKEIMDEIYTLSKEKTLIIIAHRLSTITKCKKIYKVENMNIERVDNKYE